MANPQIKSDRADALEHQQMQEFEDKILTKSLLFNLADADRTLLFRDDTGRLLQMGEDPRLPEMPEKPVLMDFIRLRFSAGGQQHLLQSANLAQKNGLPENMVTACLLHDIAVSGFIRADHGYWGAQLIEPYVEEEVFWASREGQVWEPALQRQEF